MGTCAVYSENSIAQDAEKCKKFSEKGFSQNAFSPCRDESKIVFSRGTVMRG